MKKIIFLDVDGVLATPKCWGLPSEEYHPEFGYPFDKDCVKLFNEIIEKTDAKIVFSSSWRITFNHERGNTKSLFDYNGVNRVPYDITPQKLTSTRTDEIRMWMSQNTTPEKFIILDDEDIVGFHNKFIQCNGRLGITEEIKEKSINILNN